MFLEYEKQLPLIKLYARRQGNEWLIHSLDPTDPNYKEEDYLFRLVMVIHSKIIGRIRPTTSCGLQLVNSVIWSIRNGACLP
jgi:hypothetical protein